MRGNRQPRGLGSRAGKIEGENYTGQPHGVVKAWGGGAAGVSTPTIGQYPTATIPVDDDDDGSDAVESDAAARTTRKVAARTTKSLFRTQIKGLLNWIAWMSDFFTGNRAFKAITVDGGAGGADVSGIAGEVSASGNGVFGGDMLVGGSLSIGGRAQARMIAAAFINGGTALAGSIGLDGVAPFGHGGAGSYTLKLATPVADASKLVVLVTLSTIRGFTEGVAIDAQHIAVATYTTADAPVDTTCSVVVFEVL